jgi:CRP-like cAMP-binding protein
MLGANSLSHTETISLLSHVTLFMGIGMQELSIIADKCHMVRYAPDSIIIEQGEPGDTLYVIVRGTVQVSVKTQTMGWKIINTLGPGQVVGEISILRNIPRTAQVKTIENCKFLTISAKDFLDAYKYFPPRARDNIQIIVAKRLQERGHFIRM